MFGIASQVPDILIKIFYLGVLPGMGEISFVNMWVAHIARPCFVFSLKIKAGRLWPAFAGILLANCHVIVNFSSGRLFWSEKFEQAICLVLLCVG